MWKTLGPKAVGLILVACALVYAPVQDAFFVADDFRLFGWPPIHGQSHFLQTHGKYMRPIPGLSMHWEYLLFGLNPVPPHLVNLALHGLASLLVTAIALRLMGSRTIAWIAGLLFAVHPIHTGAVSWLAARYDLFLAVFGLGSLLKLDDYLRTKRLYHLGLALLLLTGAFFSKETAVALPPVLALWAVLRRQPGEPMPWRLCAGMVAMLAGYLGLRVLVLGGISPGARVTPSWDSLVYNQTVLPLKLLLIPADDTHWAGLLTAITWGLLALASVTVIAAFAGLRKKNREADSPEGPSRRQVLQAVLFGLGIHQVSMLAMYSVLERLQAPTMPSRLLYLPSVGFCLVLAILLGSLGPRYRRSLAAAWIVAYGAITVGNNLPWREAGRITHATVKQAKAVVAESEIDGPILLMAGLPTTVHDAYVFLPSSVRNALSLAIDAKHRVQEVRGSWTDRTKDLRMQMPLAKMVALTWDPETSELVNGTERLRAAAKRYMGLPPQPTTWSGEQLAEWKTNAEGFRYGKGGLRGTGARHTLVRSPQIPLNTAAIHLRLTLTPDPSADSNKLEKKPKVFVKWESRGQATPIKPTRIPLEPDGNQVISIPCPGAASLEDLDREGLELELMFAVEGHRLHIPLIRAKKLPSVQATRRRLRQSRLQEPPQQSGAPPAPQPERD